MQTEVICRRLIFHGTACLLTKLEKVLACL